MMMAFRFPALLLGVVLLLTAIACDRSEPQDAYVIGHFGSLSGEQATFGQSTRNGIELALDEINAAGGILGKSVTVIHEDTRSNSAEAATAVQKLINRDRVQALLGEVASSNSLAAAPIAQQAQIPMLSPASTNPTVTQAGDYIFRSCFIDPFQGGQMATFALNDLKAKRFAILYDVNSDYSRGLRQFFTETVRAGGGEIVADEAYGQQVDFKGELTKIKNVNPDVIYVPGYYTQVGAIVRQARELGINVPLLGGDGWDSEKTAEIAGDALNGNYITNHYSPEDQRPEVQKFIAAYKQKHDGQVPDAMAILGYDAMHIMADAIRRAGSAEPQALRDALAATKNFPAASGVITINEERNAEKPIVILKYEGGAPRFVRVIEP